MRKKPDGITVQCVSCKAKEFLTFAEARQLDNQPTCAKCGMPMVPVRASVTLR